MSQIKVPKDYFTGLKENWKSDILSGFTIFLIALPLCIGIAIASGAPAMAGLYSGIVGGIVVSLLSGSYLTINGPAAGLIVIVLTSIETLGNGNKALGFEYTLAVIAISGIIQIILGLVRAGDFASLFPSSVIHGMLAAIGLIIIIKQFHVLLGVQTSKNNIIDLIQDIPHEITLLNPYITLIGLISIAIVLGMNYIKNETLKKIPSALVVAIVAIILQELIDFSNEREYEFLGNTYFIGKRYLVDIPESFTAGFTKPNFSIVFTKPFLLQVVIISVVASLESILTAFAVDKLDPYKRESDMNKELIAKGIGNTILGFIGGLPIIAEVVRSSANITNGAKTRWSNFFHGLFLLIFIVFFGPLIKKIPISALSALLIVVGFRLAIPNFVRMYKVGIDKFFVFMVTVYITLAEDLLLGIGYGIFTRFFINLISMYLPKGMVLSDLFICNIKIISDENDPVIKVKVWGLAVFSNFLKIKKLLYSLPKGKTVELDITEVILVDSTVVENLESFKTLYESSDGTFLIQKNEKHRSNSDHPTSGLKL
jgi:MFS superfamily sulfate permease-like transporter